MATNSFQSLHRASLLRRLSPAATPYAASSSSHSLFLKPTSTAVTTVAAAAAASSLPQPAQSLPSSSPPAAAATSLDLLLRHLVAQNFRAADEETRRLLLALAGESATKRGYVFFSEVQFVPEADLRAIDALWLDHSGGRFGYSVQKKILDKSHGDFTQFFISVGWMKRLDASDQVVQYNYRAFPAEFTWELRDDTPAGHLPLTNALRGTQLLSNILRHPAFYETIEEGDGAGRGNEDGGGSKSNSMPLMGQRPMLKADYSF